MLGGGSSDEPSAQFSGVELTSVFYGLPDVLGPEPDLAQGEGEGTRRVKVDQRGAIAYAPPRLNVDPAAAARAEQRAAADAFDFSDLRQPQPPPVDDISDSGRRTHDSSLEPVPARRDRAPGRHDRSPAPRHEPWSAPSTPPSSDRETWSGEEEEDPDGPTVALDEGAGFVPPGVAKPHFAPATPDRGNDRDSEQLERQAPARRTHGREGNGHSTVDLRNRRDRVTVESRERGRPRAAESHQRQPDGDETRERPGAESRLAEPRVVPAPAPLRGKLRALDGRRKKDVSVLTDQVREASRRSHKTQRMVKLIIALLLVAAAGAIVAVVGLTGPNLDDPSKSLRKDPLPGSTPTATDAETRSRPAEDSGPGAGASLSPDRSRADQGEPAAEGRGNLKVTSTPAGAAVHLDNVFQCETPCTIEELEDGRVYLLSIRRKSFVSWSSLIDLRRRRRVTVNAFLSEEPDTRRVGYLMIRSTPIADVLVDGKDIGRVTSEGRIPLPPGHYEITLSHPQRSARPRYLVDIFAGQTMMLTAKKF